MIRDRSNFESLDWRTRSRVAGAHAPRQVGGEHAWYLESEAGLARRSTGEDEGGETPINPTGGRGAPCTGAKHEKELATGGACLLGIVDVLVAYGWRKRLETTLLGTLCCARDISCQVRSRT